MEILYVNMQDKIIYHSSGVIIGQDVSDFNKMILQEKEKIANRDYVLNRFEHWEVDSLRTLKMILIGRSRNNTEKNLVLKYMNHISKE